MLVGAGSLLRPLDVLGDRVKRLLDRPQLDGSFLAIVDDRLRFSAGNYAQGCVKTMWRAREAVILIRQNEKPQFVKQIGQVRKRTNVDGSFEIFD